MNPRLTTFTGSAIGPWRVTGMRAVAGDPLPLAARVDMRIGEMDAGLPGAAWTLRGVTSNERYVTREEKQALAAKQQGLGHPESICAALIPIRKNAAWWALTQDERREILETKSHHIRIGMKYLPGVARRLHHCRDLAAEQPFDFLTWFEFAPSDAAAFDDLLAALRASVEWTYVDREVDIRLVLDSATLS